MEPLFSTERRRTRPPRGDRLLVLRGPGFYDPWPPSGRDPNDAAIRAARLLATAGRMQKRLLRVARRYDVDPRVFRFLLLFSEAKSPLRITDVAENMGISEATASRIVTRAIEAGLVDLVDMSPLDGREVSVRLTPGGRQATTRCLDALRPDAAQVANDLLPAKRGWSGAYGIRWHFRNVGPMDEGWCRYDPP